MGVENVADCHPTVVSLEAVAVPSAVPVGP
jgi:hypothetical protein